MLVKIRRFKYVRCIFWAWCHGYIVALTSNVFGRSFINKYLPLEISPENYWQHWWLRANGGRLTPHTGRVWWKIKIDDPGCPRLQIDRRLQKTPSWVSLFGWKCWVCDVMVNGATECCLTVNWMEVRQLYLCPRVDYLDCVPPVLIRLNIWRAPPEPSF